MACKMNTTLKRWALIMFILLPCVSAQESLIFNETLALDDNTTAISDKKPTLASKVESIMRNEFAGDVKEDNEKDTKTNFNQTMLSQEEGGSIETVLLLSHKKKDLNSTADLNVTSNETAAGSEMTKESSIKKKEAFDLEVDVDRIIDSHNNEFVLSKPKKVSVLALDPLFIQDLTLVITSSSLVGTLFEILNQPVINGYFMAGAIIGPGGMQLIKEVVQVESLAQLGIQLLLFQLGLEFSFTKMKQVGLVALFGGLLEMLLFVILTAVSSVIIGVSISVGIFVGCLLSLSSTSVVIKCLESSKLSLEYFSQIIIGTLILQDCTVGLIFTILPLLSGEDIDLGFFASDISGPPILIFVIALCLKMLAILCITLTIALYLLPSITKMAYESLSKEILQISLISYCFVYSWIVNKIGLSYELGAFLAGLMLSMTPQAKQATISIEGIKNLFTTLFIASIGLIMSPSFLWEHLSFLALSTLAVLITKILVISSVVKIFRFDLNTSLLVAVGLCQVSEFAFVLLSVGRDLDIISAELYLLLLGVTAFSLLMTPGMMAAAKRCLYTKAYLRRLATQIETFKIPILNNSHIEDFDTVGIISQNNH